MRHTNGARAGLDAGGFKGLHQLLETLPLNPAQKVVGIDLEAVKGQLVLFHTAVAQNLNLTAGHAGGRERRLIGAWGFLGQKHRQTPVIGGVGVGAGQQGHHMGAGGMGDPSLVASDFPAYICPHGAGAKRAKVRAGVRFSEDSSRQGFTRCQTRQPLGLLPGRATAQDQLGGNLGAGRQRPHADIAARQFLGHHHHRRLGQAKAAEFFRNGQAKNPHLGQLFDDLHGDQLIVEVPAVGKGDDLFLGIAAELVADHLQLFVQPRSAKGRAPSIVAHQGHKTGTGGLGVAVGHQRGCGSAGGGQGQAKITGPGHLAL